MKIIKLQNGLETIVDDDVFAWASPHKWTAIESHGHFYARRKERMNGIRVTRVLHRLIIGAQKCQMVDHVNRDTLDNRLENLRFCTHSQNCGNRKKKINATSSKYKGVHWAKNISRWIAQIGQGKNFKYLGSFASEIDAAKAYFKAATERYGSFASTNLETQISQCQVQ